MKSTLLAFFLEIDTWIDAATRSLVYAAPQPGVYGFRVRAWYDSGVSDYSEIETTVVAGRRRAVR